MKTLLLFQEKLIAQVNHMLDVDISELMGIVPPSDTDPVIRGGAFDDVKDQVSPFGFEKCEGDLLPCLHLSHKSGGKMHLFTGQLLDLCSLHSSKSRVNKIKRMVREERQGEV